MKRIACYVLCVCIILMPCLVFADVNHQEASNETIDSISEEFNLEIQEFIPATSNGIVPYATFKGDGGSVSIDCVGGKAFNVAYRLYKTTTSYFSGKIKIYTSSGTYKGTINVSFGTPIRSTLEIIPFNLKSGSSYKAYISGTATGTGITGTYSAKVIPNAHITFTYKK